MDNKTFFGCLITKFVIGLESKAAWPDFDIAVSDLSVELEGEEFACPKIVTKKAAIGSYVIEIDCSAAPANSILNLSGGYSIGTVNHRFEAMIRTAALPYSSAVHCQCQKGH